MAVDTLDGVALVIEGETAGAQRHSLIELHVAAYAAGLADYHTRAMVYGEVVANRGARVNVDAGLRVGHLCHHPGDEGNAKEV